MNEAAKQTTKQPEKAVNLRLPKEVVDLIDNEARRTRRSRAWVVGDAVRMRAAVLAALEREIDGSAKNG